MNESLDCNFKCGEEGVIYRSSTRFSPWSKGRKGVFGVAISVGAWVRREKKIKGEHPTRQELGRLNAALLGGRGIAKELDEPRKSQR